MKEIYDKGQLRMNEPFVILAMTVPKQIDSKMTVCDAVKHSEHVNDTWGLE